MINLSLNRYRSGVFGILCIILGSTELAPRAVADFEVTNLTSTNGFSSSSGFNVLGPQTYFGQGYGIAVRFTVASPSAVSFDSAEVGLAYRGGTNSITFALMTDGQGVPSGTVLETMQLANISAIPTLTTLTSTVHSVLNAGASYWLVAVYGAPDTNISWMANTTGQVGDSAYRPDTTSGIGSWVAGPSYTDASFAVFGTSIGADGVASVDAPSSGLLAGIGCLGILSGHLFKRRGHWFALVRS